MSMRGFLVFGGKFSRSLYLGCKGNSMLPVFVFIVVCLVAIKVSNYDSMDIGTRAIIAFLSPGILCILWALSDIKDSIEKGKR